MLTEEKQLSLIKKINVDEVNKFLSESKYSGFSSLRLPAKEKYYSIPFDKDMNICPICDEYGGNDYFTICPVMGFEGYPNWVLSLGGYSLFYPCLDIEINMSSDYDRKIEWLKEHFFFDQLAINKERHYSIYEVWRNEQFPLNEINVYREIFNGGNSYNKEKGILFDKYPDISWSK